MPKQKRDDSLALWKNHINRSTLTDMAEKLGRAYEKFDRADFLKLVLSDGFLALELKERINRVALCLREYLPPDYRRAVEVLIKTAPNLNEFHNWILTSYVEQFGIERFDDSTYALAELTKHGTSEFAIRPFMLRYRHEMLPLLRRWAEDANHHVRRLAAEGSRPRGVWVAHLPHYRKDPAEVIELLDKLCDDESLYVRKAVANNLNDISRDNPEIALETARRWQKKKSERTDWIIKRGLRTLIKEGHPEVFGLLGFTRMPKIEIRTNGAPIKRVQIGGRIEFPFELRSRAKSPQKLAIDYRVVYLTKARKPSPKVFKLAERTLRAGERVTFSLKHAFVDNSTRKHYPGKHSIAVQVNGRQVHSFDLKLV